MWIAARLLPQKEALALAQLKRNGFTTYLPRIRERRIVRRRVIETARPLFPSYAFISIVSQWHAARWSPGVASLCMDGARPARVPDGVIAELRGREIGGLIELPPGLKVGDRVRVTQGPFEGLHGLYAGQAPAERVLILLALLGGSRRVALPAADIKRLRSA
jgi:transcriptional antiterminator RfaH